MIRIITIEREYGSGAAQIAAKLATQLGWKLWDQQLTQEIARRAHCAAICGGATRGTARPAVPAPAEVICAGEF